MKKDIIVGRNSLRLLYFRYKDSTHYTLSIIVLIIVMSCLLIFGYIMPQLEAWFSIRNEVETTLARAEVIEDNISYVNSVNKAQLNDYVDVTTSAMPIEKSFGSILDAINASAFRSGVTFQDYSFQVGKVASTSGQTTNGGVMTDMSAVTLTLIVNGSIEQTRGFLREVYKSVPLSQITSVDGASGAITITMEFYQKDLPKVSLKDDQPIPKVIEQNTNQLIQLAEWQEDSKVADTTPANISGNLPLF